MILMSKGMTQSEIGVINDYVVRMMFSVWVNLYIAVKFMYFWVHTMVIDTCVLHTIVVTLKSLIVKCHVINRCLFGVV